MTIDTLTEPQRRVLLGAARGETSKQTAARMDRGEETIKTWRKQILARLHAQNMTQAVAIAYDLGILGREGIRPRPASEPQIALLRAKFDALDQKHGLERHSSKQAILELASGQFNREILSVTKLTFAEASWCIEEVKDRLVSKAIERPVSMVELFS